MTVGGWGRGPGGAEIRYARNGGVALAYQVIGDGDIDLVYVPDFVSNLACGWDYPLWREFYMRLSRSFRLILFDKRGTGISDHGGQFASLETRMEDLHAVLDAAGSANPVIFGAHEGGGMAVLFAATYPERTRALVLFHAEAHSDTAGSEAEMEELARLRDNWGTQEFADELLAEGCPSLAGDEESRRWFANSLRVGASPAVAYALNRAFFETDLSDVLPAVHVPTLLLYRSVMEAEDDGGCRSTPESPHDARLRHRLLRHLPLAGDRGRDRAVRRRRGSARCARECSRGRDVHRHRRLNRARRGDRRSGLARPSCQHHAIVRRELSRFRGQERDTAGDGFFATFDGPARAIRAAEAIVAGVRTIGLEARIGIHVGECEIHDGKVAGLAVAIGARVAAKAVQVKSSSLKRFATSWREPASNSPIVRHTNSKAYPAPGNSSLYE